MLFNDEDHHDHGDNIYSIDESSISLGTQNNNNKKKYISRDTLQEKWISNNSHQEEIISRFHRAVYQQEEEL
jgi:hypothetical protein